ncbi:MAG TPA: serine/threonine protein kinase, partial [Thiotrichales bacterium]|nr:serine/threonine protein kinase [Thiotrichales bacterium]
MIESPARFGKYEVCALLGQGAMGQVYLCHDPVIDRQVAVKILHPHILADRHADEMRNRFRREARAAARCQHPNIVTVYDVGDHEGRDYIVMEYVQGEELRFFLERGERLGDAERLYIVREVLEALGFAHARGVVHRDVKPANIILTDEGGVKVADFGVARIDRSDLTQAGSLMGTPTYMAPEGLRGEPVGPSGDLYSVGMVLFELVTGRRPAPEHIHSGRVGE